jgi:hypothetical protein
VILGDMFMEDDVPKHQIAQLDPTAEGLIDEQYQQAIQPADQQYGMIDKSLSDAAPIRGNIDSAIKKKYAGLVGEKLEGFRSGERINARDTRLKNIQKARSAIIAKQQVTNDIYSRTLADQRMLETARAQALSSILGFAGQMAGISIADSQKKEKAQVNIEDPMIIQGERPKSNIDRGSIYDFNKQGMGQSMSYLNDLEQETSV